MLVLNASLVPAEFSQGMPQKIKASNTNLIVARVVRAIEFFYLRRFESRPKLINGMLVKLRESAQESGKLPRCIGELSMSSNTHH